MTHSFALDNVDTFSREEPNGVLRLTAIFGFYGFSHYFVRPNFGPAWLWSSSFWRGPAWESILLVLGLFGIAHLILAWGLFERQPWARMLGLVLGILALLRIPFGTALGIYTLWALAPEPSAREWEQLTQSAYLRQA